ncbi:MAG: chemotaxis protein CheW [Pseudomonadota bacterium]|nr:chemotaxis protein CheW [Pseudomonadota bacterium]
MLVSAWRGGRRLFLDVGAVRGVLTAPRVSFVPIAPDWILGACAASGRAIAVLDLVVLEGGPLAIVAPEVVILLSTPAGLVGIATDTHPHEDRPPADPHGADILVDPLLLPERIAAALSEHGLRPRG